MQMAPARGAGCPASWLGAPRGIGAQYSATNQATRVLAVLEAARGHHQGRGRDIAALNPDRAIDTAPSPVQRGRAGTVSLAAGRSRQHGSCVIGIAFDFIISVSICQ